MIAHLVFGAAQQIRGITFIYWAALYVHLFSVIAWLGGILFVTGVARPIFEYYKKEARSREWEFELKLRFLGFSWMLLWSSFVTGAIILLWSTKFVFLDFSTLWGALIHIKILLFFSLAFYTWMLRASYREWKNIGLEGDSLLKEEPMTENEGLSREEILRWRIRMTEQLEVWTAIVLILIVTVMQVYG